MNIAGMTKHLPTCLPACLQPPKTKPPVAPGNTSGRAQEGDSVDLSQAARKAATKAAKAAAARFIPNLLRAVLQPGGVQGAVVKQGDGYRWQAPVESGALPPSIPLPFPAGTEPLKAVPAGPSENAVLFLAGGAQGNQLLFLDLDHGGGRPQLQPMNLGDEASGVRPLHLKQIGGRPFALGVDRHSGESYWTLGEHTPEGRPWINVANPPADMGELPGLSELRQAFRQRPLPPSSMLDGSVHRLDTNLVCLSKAGEICALVDGEMFRLGRQQFTQIARMPDTKAFLGVDRDGRVFHVKVSHQLQPGGDPEALGLPPTLTTQEVQLPKGLQSQVAGVAAFKEGRNGSGLWLEVLDKSGGLHRCDLKHPDRWTTVAIDPERQLPEGDKLGFAIDRTPNAKQPDGVRTVLVRPAMGGAPELYRLIGDSWEKAKVFEQLKSGPHVPGQLPPQKPLQPERLIQDGLTGAVCVEADGQRYHFNPAGCVKQPAGSPLENFLKTKAAAHKGRFTMGPIRLAALDLSGGSLKDKLAVAKRSVIRGLQYVQHPTRLASERGREAFNTMKPYADSVQASRGLMAKTAEEAARLVKDHIDWTNDVPDRALRMEQLEQVLGRMERDVREMEASAAQPEKGKLWNWFQTKKDARAPQELNSLLTGLHHYFPDSLKPKVGELIGSLARVQGLGGLPVPKDEALPGRIHYAKGDLLTASAAQNLHWLSDLLSRKTDVNSVAAARQAEPVQDARETLLTEMAELKSLAKAGAHLRQRLLDEYDPLHLMVDEMAQRWVGGSTPKERIANFLGMMATGVAPRESCVLLARNGVRAGPIAGSIDVSDLMSKLGFFFSGSGARTMTSMIGFEEFGDVERFLGVFMAGVRQRSIEGGAGLGWVNKAFRLGASVTGTNSKVTRGDALQGNLPQERAAQFFGEFLDGRDPIEMFKDMQGLEKAGIKGETTGISGDISANYQHPSALGPFSHAQRVGGGLVFRADEGRDQWWVKSAVGEGVERYKRNGVGATAFVGAAEVGGFATHRPAGGLGHETTVLLPSNAFGLLGSFNSDQMMKGVFHWLPATDISQDPWKSALGALYEQLSKTEANEPWLARLQGLASMDPKDAAEEADKLCADLREDSENVLCANALNRVELESARRALLTLSLWLQQKAAGVPEWIEPPRLEKMVQDVKGELKRLRKANPDLAAHLNDKAYAGNSRLKVDMRLTEDAERAMHRVLCKGARARGEEASQAKQEVRQMLENEANYFVWRVQGTDLGAMSTSLTSPTPVVAPRESATTTGERVKERRALYPGLGGSAERYVPPGQFAKTPQPKTSTTGSRVDPFSMSQPQPFSIPLPSQPHVEATPPVQQVLDPGETSGHGRPLPEIREISEITEITEDAAPQTQTQTQTQTQPFQAPQQATMGSQPLQPASAAADREKAARQVVDDVKRGDVDRINQLLVDSGRFVGKDSPYVGALQILARELTKSEGTPQVRRFFQNGLNRVQPLELRTELLKELYTAGQAAKARAKLSNAGFALGQVLKGKDVSTAEFLAKRVFLKGEALSAQLTKEIEAISNARKTAAAASKASVQVPRDAPQEMPVQLRNPPASPSLGSGSGVAGSNDQMPNMNRLFGRT